MKKLFLEHTWVGFLAHTVVMIIAGFFGGKVLTSAVNETIQPVLTPTQIQKEARIALSPTSALITKGSRIAVRILVYPGSVNINAVGVTLRYPGQLKVVGLSRQNSFCTLYPEEIISPNTRTVRIACGTPNPGLTASSGVVGTIIFEAVKNGNALLVIDEAESSVHANDGTGTNVLATVENNIINITNPPAPFAQKDKPPGQIMLTSSTHPQPDAWYSNKSPVLHWLREDGVEYAISLDKIPQSTPSGNSLEKTGLKEFNNLEDGIWYAHVRGKNSAGFGPVSHLKLQVDTTPPQLNIKIDQTIIKDGEGIQLNFDGADAEQFYIKIRNESFFSANSPLEITNLINGENEIYVQSSDRARNITQKSVTVYVQSGFWEDLWLQIRRFLFRE